MTEKSKNLLLLNLIYFIAVVLGIALGYLFRGLPIFGAFALAQVIVSVYLWTMSILLKNTEINGLYWSLEPFFVFGSLLIFYDSFSLNTFLLLLLVTLFSLFLTLRFVKKFQGFKNEASWYQKIREKTGSFYQVFSLFLLFLVPSMLVYLAGLPLYNYVFNASTDDAFQPMILIGGAVMLVGILLQYISAYEKDHFQKENPEKPCASGLWKYSRHPDTLGQILFWWGCFLVYILDVLDIHFLYWIASPVAVTVYLVLLAAFEEKQLAETSPDYASYKEKTSMILLLPAKKGSDQSSK